MYSLRAERAGFPEYAGQYRLESVLGSGGMGVVHLATSASGLRLAVKVVHAQHAVDPEFRARFRQEVTAARRVSGAFTAPVVDADPDAERPWMATLFIDAPTLAEQVREQALGALELARLGAGLAEALRDIHRAGVVHRDLKPSNVLMASDGVRVIDFGISRPADSDLRTETGKLIGTPPFMAPEQFQRPREVGPAADVFAMGAVLVHAATGRGPFDSDSHYLVAYQVVHSEPDLTGVPVALAPVIAQCLAKDPADRPTPDALLHELRAAAYPTGEETRAFIPQPRRPLVPEAKPAVEEDTHRRVRVEEPARPTNRRRRWRAAAALGTGLLLTGGAAGGYLHFKEDPGQAVRTSAAEPTPPGKPLNPWATPLESQGRENLVVSCSTAAGAVYCSTPGLAAARLNPADGAVTWSVRATAPGADSQSPLSAGGLVLTAAPGGRTVQAFDPGTGTQRWQKPLPGGGRIMQAGGAVMVTGGDGKATALDAATGATRWTKQIGGVGSLWLAGPDGPDGCFLYAATPADDGRSTQVSAVDCASGTVRWQQHTPGTAEPVGVSHGALHLLRTDTGSRTRGVLRVDLRTRSVKEVALPASLSQAQAAVDTRGVVYVFGASGALAAVGPDKEEWRLETGVAVASRPVADGGRVYLTAVDGRLLAVDAAAGRLMGQTKPRMGTGRSFTATVPAPVVGDGRVYGSAPDGSVFAVDAANPAGW
ncbi:PQQ-binding-like beta-propeller repeat protein [Streptomyces sp. NBC_00868]|uniref:serine/threonine-protein kinase n=1 Tax=unclassified Streptomyces TaxID=2593676 RepID=UPI0032442DA2|nr:PQQ-binding-like beta-propeller repeat protein [Streptomyces sp. NBC_00868]